MKPLHIIGLAGRMGSGKDAVADVLVKEYGFVKQSFARSLRDEVCCELLREDASDEFPKEIFDLLAQYHRNLEAVYAKPTESGMRRILQWWGTEYRRAQDVDYWVKCAEEKLPEYGRYVFTDMRFQNELELVSKLGGEAWKITRPDQRGVDPFWAAHVSEDWAEAYACFDVSIVNDLTLEDLKLTVRASMRGFE